MSLFNRLSRRDSLLLQTAATGFAGISTDAALPLYLAASALSRVFKFSSPSLRTDLLAKGAAPPRRRGPRQGPHSPSLPRPYIPEPHTSGGSGTLEDSRARLYSQEKRNKQPPLASKIRSGRLFFVPWSEARRTGAGEETTTPSMRSPHAKSAALPRESSLPSCMPPIVAGRDWRTSLMEDVRNSSA